MRAFTGVLYREWALFSTNQSDFWLALVTPVIYLLFFLPGVGQMLTGGDGAYVLFAFPGVLLIMALNVAQSVGAPVFFDRYTGEMETLFTLPVPRSFFVLGRLITALLRTWLQSIATVIIAIVLYPPVRSLGLTKVLLVVLGSGAATLMLTGLFIWVAAAVRNQGWFNVSMNVVITPLLLTSSAFYPVENLPTWLALLSKANPLTYLLASLRAIMGLQTPGMLDVIVPAGFTLVLLAGAMYRYRRPAL